MNYPKINSEVEKLNLNWREFDFGDTIYAKIPTNLLSKNVNLNNDCETEKYTIEFCADGYATIFTETEASLLKKATEFAAKFKSRSKIGFDFFKLKK